MDQIVFNAPDDGHAIAQAAGTQFFYPGCISICRVRDGVRLGGVVFSGYTGESICIHMAGWTPHWGSRDMLFVVFDYPFNQLGVKRIFGQVPETNTRALEIDRKFGFRQVARVEGVYPHDVACIVMRMDREDCRFLGVKPRNVISNRTMN